MLTVIIQARMTSSRLPGKVMADIGGKPLLQQMLGRVRRAKTLDKIVVATTTNPTDDPVAELCQRMGVELHRGSELDVLDRFHDAANAAGATVVVRLTADCPMIDPELVDEVVRRFRQGDCDYATNAIERTYPDGLDVEVMSRAALNEAHEKARLPYEREHVTPYIHGIGGSRAQIFRQAHVRFVADFAHVRWTVDRPDDLDRVRELFRLLPENFAWLQALSVATKYPGLLGVTP
jgi:spore coat polysaccharide biosynthesis protein SpsF (cytidylyltransferase family)